MQKTVLVTGGARGIGAAVALSAAARGYAVGINYRSNAARAEQVAEAVRKSGGKAVAIQADVAAESDVMRMFERVDKELGPLDALVNNAGIVGTPSRLDAMTAEAIGAVLMTNVLGSFVCAREAVRRMSTRFGGKGGSIVNLSSVAARLGGAGRTTHYAASKGAIDSFTRGLAEELAQEGIRVNAVSPGMIDTEIQDPERFARMVPRLPMKRAGTAEEVAAAVVWLMSDEASYVSGTVLDVSGAR